MQKLSTVQVIAKLKVTDFRGFGKPQKDKGSRGKLIETALGVKNSSELLDMIDGDIKTFTVGETIAITQLKHCLSEIIEDKVSFEESKVGEKLKQVIYIPFSKQNDYLGSTLLNEEVHPDHYQKLREDYNFICDNIRLAYERGVELDELGFVNEKGPRKGEPTHTINGPNMLMQIRTKASQRKKGGYTSCNFAGVTLNDKGMAFYLRADFGRSISEQK